MMSVDVDARNHGYGSTIGTHSPRPLTVGVRIGRSHWAPPRGVAARILCKPYFLRTKPHGVIPMCWTTSCGATAPTELH